MKNKNRKASKLVYFEDFLLYLQTNNYSDKTLYNYQRDLNVFTGFLSESNFEFDEVNKRVMENYKAYLNSIDRKTPQDVLARHKLSGLSVNRQLSSLRSYLKYLTKMDLPCPIAPDSISLIKTVKKVPRVADFSDLVKLIESPLTFEKNKAVSLRNHAILEVLFSTGMRISELINLKKNQIDKDGQIFLLGKGKKERFVYLTPRAKKYLQQYLKNTKDESPYVFIPFKGRNIHDREKKISTNYIQYKIKKYRELLGINIPTSPHSLRHGFATYLAEAGASPAAIQILLGHESLDTTTRYVNISHRYAKKVQEEFHPLKE
jgi:site-specific recombinase XerD